MEILKDENTGFPLAHHPFHRRFGGNSAVVLGHIAGLTMLYDAVGHGPHEEAALGPEALGHSRNGLLSPLLLKSHQVDQGILSLYQYVEIFSHNRRSRCDCWPVNLPDQLGHSNSHKTSGDRRGYLVRN
jgi:hypothetical protein